MNLFFYGGAFVVLFIHVCTLIEVVRDASGVAAWLCLGLAALLFIVGVMTHPAKKGYSQGYSLSPKDMLAHAPNAAIGVGIATFIYGVVVCAVAITRAQERLGTSDGVSSDDVGPIGTTAFAVAFATIGWLAGISGAKLKQDLIDQGVWFR